MKLVRKLVLAALILSILIFAGCTQTISEIKNESYIGKTVTVAGEVQSTLKIGKLSGYMLADKSGGTIGVSSETLPKEGEMVMVKGTLIKDSLFGYYIKAS